MALIVVIIALITSTTLHPIVVRMRWKMRFVTIVLVFVVVLTANVGSVQASTPFATGYGLLLTVQEVGTPHADEILIGFASGDYLWSRNIDGPTPVHISLPDEIGEGSDLRPFGSNPTFSARIWWNTGVNADQYKLYCGFVDWGDEGFQFVLPAVSPKVTLSDASGNVQNYLVPLDASLDFSSLSPLFGQGESQVHVEFGAVPEPGSLLALMAGMTGLGGYTLRRRK